jgi:sodium-dependent dicarboxylate transporter 2/3/5
MVKYYKIDKIDLNMSPDIIKDEIAKLGPVSRGEKNVLLVFFGTAILWITSELWGSYVPFISDETIAIFGALALFIMPVDWRKGEFTLDIKTAVRGVSWETLLLVGGSMAIGSVFAKAGVANWLGSYLGFLGNLPEFMIILILGAICALVTEVATNMVVVTAFIPVIVGIAATLGISPTLLMLTATVSSSFAFMMPQATPPNAIAVGSGAIETKDLIKVGFWVKLICVTVFPLILFGITVGVFGIR